MNGMLDAMDTIVLLNASTGRGQYSIEDLEDLHGYTVIDRDILEQSILSLLRKGLFYVAPTSDGKEEIDRLMEAEKASRSPLEEAYELASNDVIGLLSDLGDDEESWPISEIESRVAKWEKPMDRIKHFHSVMCELKDLGIIEQRGYGVYLTDFGKEFREMIWSIEDDEDYFRMQKECRP